MNFIQERNNRLKAFAMKYGGKGYEAFLGVEGLLLNAEDDLELIRRGFVPEEMEDEYIREEPVSGYPDWI